MKPQSIVKVVVLLLLLTGGSYVWWQPSRVIRGTLAGEPFCAGFPASYWADQLTGDGARQSDALSRLEKSGEESLGVLRQLLRTHPSTEVRTTALELIGKLGPVAHSASDDVLHVLQDKDTHVRAIAVKTIPQIETPAAKGVPALIPLLDSEHAAIVARAISVYRGEARSALPNLIALAQSESQTVEARWNAVRTLGKLGADGIDALPVLIELTKHPEDNIREHAAEAIGDLGPSATDGIPALIACLEDHFVKVRRDAVRSLGYIGEPAREAVPQIKRLLEDPEEIVRIAAEAALKSIAPTESPTADSPEA